MPECANTLEAAGLKGPHRWGLILPNSSRVSLLTYRAIVAVRYSELVLHAHRSLQVVHFVSSAIGTVTYDKVPPVSCWSCATAQQFTTSYYNTASGQFGVEGFESPPLPLLLEPRP